MAWYTAACERMSLKAKIEAVIYASEEPVTLAQLVGLLGVEAQAEMDAAEERQGRLALEAAEHIVPVNEAEDGGPEALDVKTLGLEEPSVATPGWNEGQTVDEIAADEIAADEIAADEIAADEIAADEIAAVETGTAPAQQGTPELTPVTGGADVESEGRADTPVRETAAAEPSSVELRARERRLRDYMRSVLDRLVADYKDDGRGLEIREIAGGYRFATKPEYHDAVRGFVRSLKPPLKLSLQALETLAVVAYKQPVTAPEVSEVRGVDSGGVLGSLMARKLVATAGRKQVIGRPILYKTTKEFLLRFGLKDVSELPSIEEFERMASDMNVALQEEIPMPDQPVVPVGTPVETGRLSTAEIERDVNPRDIDSRNVDPRDIDPKAEFSRNTHLSQADGDPNPSTPSPDEVSAEHLTQPPDGPSEFTGNESVPPAQNITADGRISGMPPVYDTPADEITDSPANDAAVERAEEQGDL